MSGPSTLVEQLKGGLDAPICLTWELTYACNLECVHCLSSSGRRDPRELTTAEAKAVLDELHALQVFYINIGGGEPMIRRDFFELLEYSIGLGIGVKFSTNGAFIDADKARRLAAMDYLDIQISLDGTDAVTNDAVRGEGSYDTAIRAMEHLRDAGFGPFKISVVVTRHNVDQLDEFKALADSFGAQLRVTRLRPSGRGAESWHDLHPTNAQQRQIYDWLVANGDNVLTGDSFFHLNALGDTPLPGLNMCGAGRVVCLIDPIGDVYACPFVIHDEFKAGSVRDEGGFAQVWKHSELFAELREPQSAGACASCGSYDACQGGCMAAKFFTGLPLDGPDPECVSGHGEAAVLAVAAGGAPRPMMDHSKPAGPPRRSVSRSPSAAAERDPQDDGSAGGRRGISARDVPERDPDRPRERRRHRDVRIGQPGRVERHPRPRLAQGAWVYGLDALKGALAAGLGLSIDGRPLAYWCGAAAIIGHMFPVFRHFRGGKGVATGSGVLLVLYPIIAPLGVAVWWVVTKLTGKAALGSVVAVVLVPIALLIDGAPAWEFVAAAGVCALIVVKHAANIKRMIRREEHSLSKM